MVSRNRKYFLNPSHQLIGEASQNREKCEVKSETRPERNLSFWQPLIFLQNRKEGSREQRTE